MQGRRGAPHASTIEGSYTVAIRQHGSSSIPVTGGMIRGATKSAARLCTPAHRGRGRGPEAGGAKQQPQEEDQGRG